MTKWLLIISFLPKKKQKKNEFDRIVKFFIFYQDLFFFLKKKFRKIKSLRKLKITSILIIF